MRMKINFRWVSLFAVVSLFLLSVFVVVPQMDEPPSPKAIEQGRVLFVSLGCSTCHGDNALGTDIAPSLVGT